MWKKYKIVVLATKNKNNKNIGLDKYFLYQHSDTKTIVQGYMNSLSTKNMYIDLYVISDDEIEEGDWYIDDTNEIRKSLTSDKEYWNNRKNYKKIIASTNDLQMEEIVRLPNINQEFIKFYIEENNKGNIITEGMVEYEDLNKLKINENYTVNIKKVKDSWNKEEVIKLCSKAWLKTPNTPNMLEEFNKWIDINLE